MFMRNNNKRNKCKNKKIKSKLQIQYIKEEEFLKAVKQIRMKYSVLLKKLMGILYE
jgi:hypothetical protein